MAETPPNETAFSSISPTLFITDLYAMEDQRFLPSLPFGLPTAVTVSVVAFLSAGSSRRSTKLKAAGFLRATSPLQTCLPTLENCADPQSLLLAIVIHCEPLFPMWKLMSHERQSSASNSIGSNAELRDFAKP
jgi:hypothetical protein